MIALSFPCHLQRNLSQATQEQKQLSEKLKDETEQKEQLRRLKNEMENERWHLDKTIEKLQKEVRERAWDPAPRKGPIGLRSPAVCLSTNVSGICRSREAALRPC